MQAGVRAALLEGSQSLGRRRPDRVAADDKYQYGIGLRPLRAFDTPPITLTVPTIGRDRRALGLSALGGADPVPREFQRKVGSDIAPLLQPRAKWSIELRRHGARILRAAVAGPPDRLGPRGGAGGFPSISVRPCRGARRVQLGGRSSSLPSPPSYSGKLGLMKSQFNSWS